MTETSVSYVTELEERLAALEMALESADWRLLSGMAEQEFSREGLRTIAELSRIMYLKNPLVQRSVDVKRLYVWAQGWTVKAEEPEIQEVIDAFLADEKNDDELGNHEARMGKEIDLETEGNLFFVFFVNQATGRVRVRTISFDEIEDIACDPDDTKSPWYYRRIWTETRLDTASGATLTQQHTAYYPDWRYKPTAKPQSIGSTLVRWESPIYHVKVGGFSGWKFGVPEVYDLIDWAKAYKEFLEDWASIVRAYRRFAFQLTTPGGSRGVAAAKARLNTTLGSSSGASAPETNPPPLTGSTFIAGEGHNLTPIRTSGATVSAEDGRRLLLMVAAGAGLPETFYGDASIGSLATAKSLDRPTELMMEDRQQLWRGVYQAIFAFVQFWAVKAANGPLRALGTITTTVEDGQVVEQVKWNDGIDATVMVEFPPLLQHDIPEMVGAMVQAATLGAAGTLAGTMDLPTLSRLLLVTLGANDVDSILEQLFPNGEAPLIAPPTDEEPPPRPQSEAMMVQAVAELRTALVKLQEGQNGVGH